MSVIADDPHRIFIMGLRRIEWVILRLKTPQSWGLQGAFAFLRDLNLA